MSELTEVLLERVDILKRQSKKNQIFGEKLPEAEKMAEAGLLIIQIAQHTDSKDEKKERLVEAAACLSRAKRLCREVSRGK